jgi:hypothetical protein
MHNEKSQPAIVLRVTKRMSEKPVAAEGVFSGSQTHT